MESCILQSISTSYYLNTSFLLSIHFLILRPSYISLSPSSSCHRAVFILIMILILSWSSFSHPSHYFCVGRLGRGTRIILSGLQVSAGENQNSDAKTAAIVLHLTIVLKRACGAVPYPWLSSKSLSQTLRIGLSMNLPFKHSMSPYGSTNQF